MAIGPFENSVAWHLNESDPPAVSGTEISQSAYSGSMQQILRENVGNYVICEFLVGTQNLERKEGILYSVGVSFIVLYSVYNQEERFVILTTEGNASIRDIHHRMPVVISPDHLRYWLGEPNAALQILSGSFPMLEREPA